MLGKVSARTASAPARELDPPHPTLPQPDHDRESSPNPKPKPAGSAPVSHPDALAARQSGQGTEENKRPPLGATPPQDAPVAKTYTLRMDINQGTFFEAALAGVGGVPVFGDLG